MEKPLELVNWPWLEDLLVRACEIEIGGFAGAHPNEPFFACCLEYEGITGCLGLSYGSRCAVDARAAVIRKTAEEDGEGPLCYRGIELRPENWRFRCERVYDPQGYWGMADSILEPYRRNMQAEPEREVAEFLWMRFEYLTECVVQRLLERDAFRALPREPEFLVYASNEHEYLEELEDRICKLFPRYRRATAELVGYPRPGELPPKVCPKPACARRTGTRDLVRCTYCQSWFCERCRRKHAHPELALRRSFFT